MADPLTFAVATIIIPGILDGIQNGLQFALDTMPEIHDARIKHAVKKFNELLLKARKGELTEKDFQHAKHYYCKIQAVALISENQTLLEHLEKGLSLMEGTLVAKNLMDKKTEIQSSDIDILNSKIQEFKALNVGDAIVETCEKHSLPDYASTINTPDSLDGQISRTTEKNPVKSKAWERPAMWCMVAVMPPLLFIPKVRHKC